MKKIAFLLLMIFLLCAVVTAGFYYTTQYGFLSRDLYIYSETQEAGLKLRQIDDESQNILLDAVRSTEKFSDPAAAFLDSAINLRVIYWPNITMNYEISYNPYTGTGAIKKGLLNKSLYKVPADTMTYILSPESISLNKTSDDTDPQQIEEQEYFKLIQGLEYIGGKPDILTNPKAYNMELTTIHGTAVKYDIQIDFSSKKAFVNTSRGYYSISEDSAKMLLSLEKIYTDYKSATHPIPEISLSIGFVINPQYSEKNWTRIKPSGEIVLENLPDSYNVPFVPLNPGQKIEAEYKSNEKPDAIILYEYKNGELANEFNLLLEDVYVPEFQGELIYSLKAIYEHATYPESYGTIIHDYSFLIDMPAEATIKYAQVRPGDILAFYVKYTDEGETFSLESNLGNFKADFMPYGENLMLYMPVNWWTTPKDYSATIYKKTGTTKEIFSTYSFTIVPDNFETIYQQLVVSDELAKKADPVNTANDAIVIKEAKSHSNKTSYLDGLFIMPLNGDLGTSYAQTRYINGKNPYRHSGLDIDGETGDPIIAANRGEVVFAGELVRTGNTVIIDHGMELFSSYLHMSAFDVKAGDFVEKGDLIGKVGSTGFSTGSHLHWSITLYGNYMNPLWLVENSIVPD